MLYLLILFKLRYVHSPVALGLTGAPYNRWIFGGGLRLYPEQIAKKIPMGFDSMESFAKVDENSNVAD
jgi:hypothetical protein